MVLPWFYPHSAESRPGNCRFFPEGTGILSRFGYPYGGQNIRARVWAQDPSVDAPVRDDIEATDEMSENPDLVPGLAQDDQFEVQMRGYSRRQVDEFVARSRSHARDLEERLSRALDEVERLRREVSTARQSSSGGKPHEELSDRMRQILKLADDEAAAQKTRANDEVTKQRADAQQAADRARAEAKEQSDRMLTAAQEQAEQTIASSRAEAEKTRTNARTEAERMISESRKNADNTTSAAKVQARQTLDEATARASAIHDGAERRLDLLKNRHAEAMRRLTEIRDVVTDLVAHDDAKGTMDEEVDKTVASTLTPPGGPGKSAGAASAAPKATPAAPAGQRPAAQPAAAQPGGDSSGGTHSAGTGPARPASPARSASPASPGGASPAGTTRPANPASPGGASPASPASPGGAGRPAGTGQGGNPGTEHQRARHAAPRGQAGTAAGPTAADRSSPPDKPGPGTPEETTRGAETPKPSSSGGVRLIKP